MVARRGTLLFAGSMAILGSYATCSSHSMPLFSHPIVPRCSLLLVLLAVVVSAAAAQDTPVYEVHSDYTARQWTVRDGLPTNFIHKIVQTDDGLLWMGTIEGLVRFDGQQFTVFNVTNTPVLGGNRIGKLDKGAPGHLWIRSPPASST